MSDLRELRAGKLQAEIAALEAHKRKAEIEVACGELEQKFRKRELDKMEASFEDARVFYFNGEVNRGSVDVSIHTLGTWARNNPGEDLTVIFNSPGGSVFEGFALFDFLRDLSREGHKIVAKSYGMAASMGGILLQAGDERVMGKNAYLLIHEVSAGAIGNVSELHDKAKFAKQLWDQGADILAARSTLTPQQVKRRAERKDWWIPASEAVSLGFADRIEE